MLCQFTVKNFKCIKDEVTLDMQAANITEHENTLLTDIDGEKFLPLGVIYGPNGSGKSTVLFAFISLTLKIMIPICITSSESKDCLKEEKFIIVPFKFDGESVNNPTEYEIFFRTTTHEYHYQLAVLKNKVVSEFLYKKSFAKQDYEFVFSRENNTILLGEFLKKDDFAEDISDTLTLLSYLGITHRRNETIKDVINWFEKIDGINYSTPGKKMRIQISEDAPSKSIMLNMLKEMDIDIVDYRVEEKDDDKIEIFTSHEVDNKSYELRLIEESSGTIKLFSVLSYIANSIKNGTVLVIDELDASLHPLLLKYIINLFSNPEINRNKAQLIFTSHDLSTMNSEIFRRDEIWFVAKGENLASKLYSLDEIKHDNGKSVRKDEKYDKRYLAGRYGADPYLRKIIDWGKV